MTRTIQRVAVIGAAADQGVPLIGALKTAGLTPVAAIRRMDAMQQTPFPNVETVFADIMEVSSLTKAFEGVEALALHLPFEHNREKAALFGQNVADAARAAKLKKIVFNTSCYVADKDLGISAHDGRRDIEAAIAASGVPYVFIEPVVFMNNMVAPWCKPSIVQHGVFAYPASHSLRISFISLDDVGALMVQALLTDKADGQKVAVGGPEPLTGADVARALSGAAGREIAFTSLTPDTFAENISELVTGSRSIPQGSVYDGMARFYRYYNLQPSSPLAVDPASFLDRLPVKLTSFSDWAAAQDWAPPN